MFLEAFNKDVEKGSTVLHVRRGDYLKLNENLSNKFMKLLKISKHREPLLQRFY